MTERAIIYYDALGNEFAVATPTLEALENSSIEEIAAKDAPENCTFAIVGKGSVEYSNSIDNIRMLDDQIYTKNLTESELLLYEARKTNPSEVDIAQRTVDLISREALAAKVWAEYQKN